MGLGHQTGKGIITKSGNKPANFRHIKEAPRPERDPKSGMYTCSLCPQDAPRVYGTTTGLDGHALNHHKVKFKGPGHDWRRNQELNQAANARQAAKRAGTVALAKTPKPKTPAPQDPQSEQPNNPPHVPRNMQELMLHMGGDPSGGQRGRPGGPKVKGRVTDVQAMFEGVRGRFVMDGLHTSFEMVRMAVKVKRQTYEEMEALMDMAVNG